MNNSTLWRNIYEIDINVQGVSEHQDKNKGKKAVLPEFQILK